MEREPLLLKINIGGYKRRISLKLFFIDIVVSLQDQLSDSLPSSVGRVQKIWRDSVRTHKVTNGLHFYAGVEFH